LHTLRGPGLGVRRATYARGHDPESGDHGTLSAENPYQPASSGAGGKLRHLIWQKPSCEPQIGTSQSASLWRWGRSCSVKSRGSASTAQEQSAAPALFALRESPVDRMAPSPLDITSVATQPMDWRRSEVETPQSDGRIEKSRLSALAPRGQRSNKQVDCGVFGV
jgi:hypothetical protein